nr:MAG TPA: DksA-like zinc finger domain containing protein [Caudoviricetes sp.]
MTAEIIDQANDLAQQRIDMAIAAHRINRDAVSATHCSACDEELPEARRKAYPGCTMCVSCLEEIEMRNKQRGL